MRFIGAILTICVSAVSFAEDKAPVCLISPYQISVVYETKLGLQIYIFGAGKKEPSIALSPDTHEPFADYIASDNRQTTAGSLMLTVGEALKDSKMVSVDPSRNIFEQVQISSEPIASSENFAQKKIMTCDNPLIWGRLAQDSKKIHVF
jgi:hypothetical protein